MEQKTQSYPTDLTDEQWEIVEPMLMAELNKGKWSKRTLLDAVFYIEKTGGQWRNLPHDFPPYQTVYSFFDRAKKRGLWERINFQLVEMTRKKAGREPEPSFGIIDSQSIKTIYPGEKRGIDGGKKN